ncbi:DNA mismatch repair protein MutS [Desulfohalovibrio reitneri]|uniref:DNA mismatch repair protein MutS n=1 Tax=Desulfohalovibrio reitneri TaxID=1307759 RepID=UPI0004A741A7|nr:DNA mismatch repair protein MutS [Desulfohalovibrio reitneri]
MTSKTKLTPMFEQYLRMKEEHPDSLLFFRMGDFYELFFEDAETAARELQIALTSRNPNQETRVPMCGVPHHSADNYISQLLGKGYKVAVCDQVEDPKEAKGLVKRAVTRVMTPGTVTEESNLDAKDHNYLAALLFDAGSGTGAVAWIDFSTGQWSGFESRSEPVLWQWLQKMDPSEVLLAAGTEPPTQFAASVRGATHVPPGAFFDRKGAERKLMEAQGVTDLSVLDLADKPQLVRVLGGLLTYLRQTQMQDPNHLGTFQPLNLGKFCIIDEITERNLEIFRTLDGRIGKGTLRHAVDQTLTPMGGRLLEERLKRPWRDPAPIRRSLDAVQRLVDRPDPRAELRSRLGEVFDLERLSTRVFLGRATPKDLAALRHSLSLLPGLAETLRREADESPLPEAMAKMDRDWDDMADIRELLESALVDSPPPVITEGGLFRKGHSEELDELIRLTDEGEGLVSELLRREREHTGQPKLKLGFNKVFGYYFELSRSQAGELPGRFNRRQTLVNAERFITDELKELEEKLLSASDQRRDLEYSLFIELREKLARVRPRFLAVARAVAELDLWQGLAEVAHCQDWTRPALTPEQELRVRSGRHPVVEAVQGRAGFVPNDLSMEPDSRLLIITGPNMAGKSTVLRQAALIALLAQVGSYVPASEATVGLVDRIFSRVGASDNLAQGQSTFMVEMTETARILRQATKRSLVILDEIGRGTGTFDGMALAWSVVEELSRRGSGSIRTLFATHYHELTVLEGHVEGVRNYNIAVKEYKGEMIFLRRLVPGPSDKSYGVEVAKLAGVPHNVVQRAKTILGELERSRGEDSTASRAAFARQALLPGLAPPVEPSGDGTGDEEHPVLSELRGLSVDGISPMAALQLIYQWKDRLDTQ